MTLLGAWVLGCGSDVDSTGDGGAGASTTTGGTSSDGGGGATNAGNVPEACVDVPMFETRACLDSLRAHCLPFGDAGQCAAAEVIELGDPEVMLVQVACRWADVVTIGDAASCSVSSVSGRCEAVMPQFDHLCAGGACDQPGSRTAWRVLPDKPSELVKTDCGVPLGYWAEVGYEYQPDEGTCLNNVHPPAPPLCDCAPAACAALGEP